MGFEKIELQMTDAVATIRLNQPAILNATTYQMLEEVDAALDQLTSDTRALILTGAGRAFCAGAGLDDFSGGDGVAPDYGLSLETHVNPLLTRLRDLDIPWITAVRGAAAGFGCSLALAGDLIIATEGASFIQAFARVGLVPDGGSTYVLTRAIGKARALEMMLLGDKVPARQALEWGLINRVVPDEQLEASALELAQRLASGPTVALRLIRRTAWAALDSNWELALRSEREAQRVAGLTADFSEGLAAFREKRTARFLGK